jgi:hypothetical protein
MKQRAFPRNNIIGQEPRPNDYARLQPVVNVNHLVKDPRQYEYVQPQPKSNNKESSRPQPQLQLQQQSKKNNVVNVNHLVKDPRRQNKWKFEDFNVHQKLGKI